LRLASRPMDDSSSGGFFVLVRGGKEGQVARGCSDFGAAGLENPDEYCLYAPNSRAHG